jgi:DNA-binding CsgD family transcriptional regulator
VSHALKSLSYREREILRLISGVGDGFKYTREEVAHIFRVTPERIDAIVKKAMQKVKRRLDSSLAEFEIPPAVHSGINVAVAIPEYCEDRFVVDKLVDLYVALNGMHKGAGGTGLIINDDQTCSGTVTLEGTPI